MLVVDSHCHLDFEGMEENLPAILGRDPAFSADGQRLIFARVVTQGDLGPTPDGNSSPYTIVSSELWALNLATGHEEPLLADSRVHARYPTIAGPGQLLFVNTIDGSLWRLNHGLASSVGAWVASGVPPRVMAGLLAATFIGW